MHLGFWKKLKRPFFTIAPMADVTDIAFRQIIAKYSCPDVFYTEFVSAAGLASEKGRIILEKDLRFSEKERPIVAQIFGADPEQIFLAVKLIKKLGFDGVEINMGCPDKKVEKQGAGAALIKKPELAQALILAAKKAAGTMPVSVKTRIGYNKNIIQEWARAILESEPAALIIHGRTRKEMSAVPAHWDAIAEAVKVRDEIFSKTKNKTLIIGNGDIASYQDGLIKAKNSGVDGLMIGRGIFGNPWFFSDKDRKITTKQKLKALLEHVRLFEKLLLKEKIKNFQVMKKHFKAYINGFSGAKELRIKLMEAESPEEVKRLIILFLKNN